jgi:hypothetical protein
MSCFSSSVSARGTAGHPEGRCPREIPHAEVESAPTAKEQTNEGKPFHRGGDNRDAQGAGFKRQVYGQGSSGAPNGMPTAGLSALPRLTG